MAVTGEKIFGSLRGVGEAPHSGETMARPPKDWLPELLARIGGFASLKADWDSYGGKPTDSKAIAHARTLVVWLAGLGMPEPSVSATPNGSVGFSWDEGWSLDVECRPDGVLSYVYLPQIVEGTTRDPGDLLRFLKP